MAEFDLQRPIRAATNSINCPSLYSGSHQCGCGQLWAFALLLVTIVNWVLEPLPLKYSLIKDLAREAASRDGAPIETDKTIGAALHFNEPQHPVIRRPAPLNRCPADNSRNGSFIVASQMKIHLTTKHRKRPISQSTCRLSPSARLQRGGRWSVIRLV